METKLRTMIATDSLTIFRKDEWFSPFAKHCTEYMVFIKMLPGTHPLFKDSQQKQKDDHLGGYDTVVESIDSVAVFLYLSTN